VLIQLDKETRDAYPKPIFYNRLDKGEQFSASEQLQIFAEETRAASKSLRQPT